MARVERIEIKNNEELGRIQPTQVVAFVKIFKSIDKEPILQIDTYGSAQRMNPDLRSQTLQFGQDAAKQLIEILQNTYHF